MAGLRALRKGASGRFATVRQEQGVALLVAKSGYQLWSGFQLSSEVNFTVLVKFCAKRKR